MRKIIFIVILVLPAACFSQNYQCLQAGVKHYFTNANGYLRGIRIDSVTTSGGDIIYYPFHTPRGAYSLSTIPVLDSNGGSWLGKRVLQKSDGTFIFDSYWNDSVIIRTQANVGDSWTFYRDTSSLYYTATVVSVDTMSFLSTFDSVKRIMINAYNSLGPVTTDPLDRFRILLSKNNGFVQVFDLYTFPYHKPDSTYRMGLDFFLDESGYGAPGSATFKLVNFIIPNDQQLHNWDVGDIIASTHEYTPLPPGLFTRTDFILNTVISKDVTTHATNYVLGGTLDSCVFWRPCLFISNAGGYTFTDSNYPIVDTNYLPESHFPPGDEVFYFPNDTGHCLVSPAYVVVPVRVGFSEMTYRKDFKLGIGLTYYNYDDEGEGLYETDKMIFSRIQGINCGPLYPGSVPQPVASQETTISPNPTHDKIRIDASYPVTSIIVSNFIGQVFWQQECNKNSLEVDVSNLPTGVYFIRINGTEVRKFVKE